jgi:beta-glucanase (GH16 family)
MKILRTTLLFSVILFSFVQCQTAQETVVNNYKLVWADEFDGNGLPDSTKWNYDFGDGCPDLCGWGNNELQFYTKNRSENARVEKGLLIIEAHKEKMGSRDYSSARLVSKQKGDWTYGKIDIRAKLPSGLGTWPAIWMLPTDWEYGGWPSSGEIDIMEHVGYEPDSVFGSVHTKTYHHSIGTQKTGGVYLPDCEKTFHTYSVIWTKESITYLVDDVAYFSFKNENKTFKEYPFDKRFYLILNLAVGGNWGGKNGIDPSIFPKRMEIDYVRVYQQ